MTLQKLDFFDDDADDDGGDVDNEDYDGGAYGYHDDYYDGDDHETCIFWCFVAYHRDLFSHPLQEPLLPT